MQIAEVSWREHRGIAGKQIELSRRLANRCASIYLALFVGLTPHLITQSAQFDNVEWIVTGQSATSKNGRKRDFRTEFPY